MQLRASDRQATRRSGALWDRQGDAINAVLAAAGYNFSLLLKWLRLFLLRILARSSQVFNPQRLKNGNLRGQLTTVCKKGFQPRTNAEGHGCICATPSANRRQVGWHLFMHAGLP
jgi:hypothetical protein